jgi:hypothetical protein
VICDLKKFLRLPSMIISNPFLKDLENRRFMDIIGNGMFMEGDKDYEK